VVGGYGSHLWIDMVTSRVDLFCPRRPAGDAGQRQWWLEVGGKGKMVLLSGLLIAGWRCIRSVTSVFGTACRPAQELRYCGRAVSTSGGQHARYDLELTATDHSSSKPTYYLLGGVEIPTAGPALTGRLESVDTDHPASYRTGFCDSTTPALRNSRRAGSRRGPGEGWRRLAPAGRSGGDAGVR